MNALDNFVDPTENSLVQFSINAAAMYLSALLWALSPWTLLVIGNEENSPYRDRLFRKLSQMRLASPEEQWEAG